MNRFALLFCFALFALAFARNEKDKYGILYVNEITANSDTGTVQIESSFVDGNILHIDELKEWTGAGITAESIYFKNGDVVLADDFVANTPTTFPGVVHANGGLYGDKPNNDYFSFLIEDNTGRTSLSGLLTVDGDISTQNGLFTVVAGETTVDGAATNANGGIAVGAGFVADTDGNLFVDSSIHAQETINLGNTDSADRYIRREVSPAQFGGQTIFGAQDGISAGGDVYIVPGQAQSCANGNDCNDGVIFVGDNDNSNVRVVRPWVDGDAGTTTYNGQSSSTGNGGKIVIQAGDSTFGGNGGDIVLIPGLSPTGDHGAVYFGSNEGGISDFNLRVQRPGSTLNGGDTFVEGQSTQNGSGGNLNLVSGQGATGAPLRFYPGDVPSQEQGEVYFGNPESANLMIKRSDSNAEGGNTVLVGQDSLANRGGDLYVEAGAGNGNGGNLYLQPGSSSGTAPGSIYVGNLVTAVDIMRPASVGGGLDTVIGAQDGLASQGGDLHFFGGNGATVGGALNVNGGAGDLAGPSFNVGGGVIFEAGNGQIDGGDIVFSSPSDGNLDLFGGQIYFNAGSGPVLGDVVVGDDSELFRLTETPIVINNSYMELQEGSDSLIIRADPSSIISHNGNTLLRSTGEYHVPEVSVLPIALNSDLLLTETTARLAELQNSLEILVNNLSQCQHGLFLTIGATGPDSCACNV